MTVQRFDPNMDERYMEIHSSGDYVYYDEYENLEIELEDLQNKYDDLVQKLNDIVVLA